MPQVDLSKPENIRRLVSVAHASLRDMDSFLRERNECVSAYLGPRYAGQEGGLPHKDLRISLPLMEMDIELHVQNIVGEEVRALVTSRTDPSLDSVAEDVTAALNVLLDELNFTDMAHSYVREAMWGLGTMKVGRSHDRRSALTGFQRGAAPFVDVVSAEDVILDLAAPSLAEMQFVGDRYAVPTEWAKDFRGFDSEARSELHESAVDPSSGNGRVGNWTGTGRLNWVSTPVFRERLYPITYLYDLYLPLQSEFVTIAEDGNVPLYRGQWVGPSTGTYDHLAFRPVRKTPLPKPPAWSWLDVYTAANVINNKIIRQAERSKFNPIFQGRGAAKDVERLQTAPDGVSVEVDNMAMIGEWRVPGPEAGNVSLAAQLVNLFSYVGNNMNLLGGLAAQSATLGQDQILVGQGTRQLQQQRRTAVRALRRALRALAWYLFQDRKLDMPVRKEIAGMRFLRRLRHQDLRGLYLRLNFDVEPMRTKSQEERLAQMTELLGGVLPTLIQSLRESGRTLDVEQILKTFRDLSDLPGLDKWIRRISTPAESGQRRPQGSTRSVRTYVRRSEAMPQQLPQFAG